MICISKASHLISKMLKCIFLCIIKTISLMLAVAGHFILLAFHYVLF